jgi:hypothetical protein
MEDKNKWSYASISPCAFMSNIKTTLPFYAIVGKEEALRTAVIRVKLLSTHFVSNLCSLLIEATTAMLTLLADTDYNLLEPTKIADAKTVNPKQVKRRSARNDSIFLEDCQ